MNPTEAKRLVVASVIVTGLISTAGTIGEGKTPRLRIAFGLLFAGTVLAFGVEISPDVAGSFALLLLASSLFVYGGPALKAMNHLLGAPPAAAGPVGASGGVYPQYGGGGVTR